MRGWVAFWICLGIFLPASPARGQWSLQKKQDTTSPKRSAAAEKVHEGNLFFTKGDFEGALRRYEEVLRETSEEAQAKVHYNLANTLTQLGRFEEAKKEYAKSLRVDSKNEDTKYNLEMTFLMEGGQEGNLKPQAELEGSSDPLDQEILQILQVLEQQEFDFPKGTPQQPMPPQPQTKKQGKDW